MIEPAPLAAKLTGSKEIRHAALPVKKRSGGDNLRLCRVRIYKVYKDYKYIQKYHTFCFIYEISKNSLE